MSLLTSPFTLRQVTYKNRIVMSPMCQYMAHNGYANDWHFVHYTTRAVGGVGLVMIEATAVSPEGRISPEDLGLWEDGHMDKLKTIVESIHQYDCKVGIQLAHAGRKAGYASPFKGHQQLSLAAGGWNSVAPSAIPYTETDRLPQELTLTAIENVVQAFRKAAERAVEIGVDVIEIHAAHGYLLHQFLSPLSNHRTDKYGGSFENRTRFLMEVINEIKKVMQPQQNLFVRISATDYVEGGWDIQQSVNLAKQMKTLGVDLVDCSSGALVPDAAIKVFVGYQVPFAQQVKKEAEIATGAVGLILNAEQAEGILQEGKADMIFLARELLRNPYFALQAAQNLDGENAFPPSYQRAFRAPKSGK